MKKIIFVIALLLGITLAVADASAQSDLAMVDGVVTVGDESPLEGAQVIALAASDSAFLMSTTTDARGEFHLAGLSQACLVRVSYLGYVSQTKPGAPAMKFLLEEDSKLLGEVSVSASRLKLHETGYSLSLRNSPLARGRKVTDVLSMLPNVAVREGSISILGRPIVAIYIDDVPSSIKEVTALRATQVESMDIDYSTAARESAEKLGGVLRIKLSPSAHNGLVGIVTAEGTAAPRYGITGGNVYNGITAKIRRVSLRNRAYVSRRLLYSDYHNTTTYTGQGAPLAMDYYNEYRNPETYLYDRLHLSGNVGDHSTLSASGFYSLVDEKPVNKSSENSGSAIQDETGASRRDHTAQAVMRYAYNEGDKSFSLTTDYLYDQILNASDNAAFKTSSRQTSHMIRIRPEYTLGVGKAGGRLSIGADYRMIRMSEQTEQPLIPVSTESHTPAIYTSFQGQSGSLMYSAGLRYQYLRMKTRQEEGEDKSYNHSFGSLYPSLTLTYLINPQKGHILMLQTERGTEQVPYSVISGYRVYRTPHLYTVGNPRLRTPINWQSMAMLQLWGQLALSAVYIHYKDPINFRTLKDPSDPSTLYTMPVNGSYQSLLGFAVEWDKEILPQWATKLGGSFTLHSGDMGYTSVKNQSKWNIYMDNRFSFNSSCGGGLNASYEPTSHYLDRTLEKVYYVKAYLYKSLLKGDLELRADALLAGNGRTIVTETPNLRLTEANVTSQPYLTLSLTYHFRTGEKPKTTPFTDSTQSYEQIRDNK